MQTKNSNIFTRQKEYPQVDNLVVFYVGVVLFFQILLQISPAVTALAASPLYSIQTYLGVLGGGLILLDLFTTKRVWQGKYIFALLAILGFAALATDRMVPYGVKENLFKLCWMGIQFCLVYSCAYRIPKEQLEERIKTLFYALLTVWLFACCISFVQYVNRVEYQEVVNPLAQDTSANWQGYHNNRLYGIFYTLNHAAYVSLFFAIIAAACAMREKRVWVRICLMIAQVLLLVYIILNGSRSALLAMLICALLAGWFVIRRRLKTADRKKAADKQNAAIVFIAVLLVIALCCTAGYVGIQYGLIKLPDVSVEDSPLDRPDMEDMSNGRLRIWADYVSLYKEIGAIGLSPGSYMPYILQNHPELFVVKAAKHFNPDKYDSGIIYHMHSGYLTVYVGTGIFGLAALAVFMALTVRQLIRRIRQSKKANIWFVCGVLIVVAGAVSAVFDEGLFFQNSPQTTIFWFALGLLMSDHLRDTEEISQEERCNENVG